MNILREIRNIDRSLEEGRISFQEAADRVEPFKDAEPVIHAHWKKVGGYVTPGGDPVWACSNCGKGVHVWGVEAITYNRDVSGEHQWVACPNCGAKMDGE